MTKEEIVDMARQAGVRDDENVFEFSHYKYLERFAKLVAHHEREACADLLMGLHEAQSNNGNHNYYHFASNAIKKLRKQE